MTEKCLSDTNNLNSEILDEKLSLEDLATTQMTWNAEVTDFTTVIRANFGDKNPNKELVEINVRETCFFPKTTGINYITVKGLHMAQAATQWSPPTGEQIGIIGPNWSKGWIIEECEITQSKCVGVCLGKERASGHNLSALYHDKLPYTKHGFNREIEVIFKAYDLGWSKENIGSHIVRNNKIHDCNQAGIVGHLGAIFSTIIHNEIYDINHRPYINGAETAGIKLHAAIDVIISGNCITNATRGLWLDWQAQGTQVSRNIFDKNNLQDLFIEVSHGPTMVYNNLFLSKHSLHLVTQGVAIFNNLISGSITSEMTFRYTPYHIPHSTKIKGLHNTRGGDMHFYNNIFLATNDNPKSVNGLNIYKDYPTTADSLNLKLHYGVQAYHDIKLPVNTGGNLYLGELSSPHPYETDYYHTPEEQGSATLSKSNNKYYLQLEINTSLLNKVKTRQICTTTLGEALIPEAIYENPDETPFSLTKDFFGNERDTQNPTVGPFEICPNSEILIWQ